MYQLVLRTSLAAWLGVATKGKDVTVMGRELTECVIFV